MIKNMERFFKWRYEKDWVNALAKARNSARDKELPEAFELITALARNNRWSECADILHDLQKMCNRISSNRKEL